MATLYDIRERVKVTVQDTSYSEETIDSFINEGLQRVAALVLLPSLVSSGQVTTSITAQQVAIPTSWNFDRNLFLCTDADGVNIPVLSSTALMQRKLETFGVYLETGDLEACAIDSAYFLYYPVPITAKTLSCMFYQNVTTLTSDSDAPSCLPEFLHYRLLESFAAAELYDRIEDGMEDTKINARHYMKKFNEALAELQSYLRTGQSRPVPYRVSGWI